MREHFYENSCWLKAFETRLCSELELFFKNLSDSIKFSVFRKQVLNKQAKEINNWKSAVNAFILRLLSCSYILSFTFMALYTLKKKRFYFCPKAKLNDNYLLRSVRLLYVLSVP